MVWARLEARKLSKWMILAIQMRNDRNLEYKWEEERSLELGGQLEVGREERAESSGRWLDGCWDCVTQDVGRGGSEAGSGKKSNGGKSRAGRVEFKYQQEIRVALLVGSFISGSGGQERPGKSPSLSLLPL